MQFALNNYSSEKVVQGLDIDDSLSEPVDVEVGLPRVTVIMPVRNAVRFIERSLGRLLVQDYPHEQIEVLIVDGMSEDGTTDVVRKMISNLEKGEEPLSRKSALSIRVVDNPLRVVPSALNIGLQHADGEIVFRLDGHSEMAPDYISKCVRKLLERPDVVCVGGPSVAAGSGWIGQAYAAALRSKFGVGGGTFRTLRTESYVDTLAFGGYRREVFDRLGGFDPALWRNQDVEFSARLRKAGFRMLLIGDTQTTYHAPRTLSAIVRQSFSNGFWNTKALNKMAGVLSWRHFVPGVFVVSILICVFAVFSLAWGKYLLLFVCGSYILSALTASFTVALRSRQRTRLLMPLMFAVMHLSYGLGSLVGLGRYAVDSALRVNRRET